MRGQPSPGAPMSREDVQPGPRRVDESPRRTARPPARRCAAIRTPRLVHGSGVLHRSYSRVDAQSLGGDAQRALFVSATCVRGGSIETSVTDRACVRSYLGTAGALTVRKFLGSRVTRELQSVRSATRPERASTIRVLQCELHCPIAPRLPSFPRALQCDPSASVRTPPPPPVPVDRGRGRGELHRASPFIRARGSRVACAELRA